MFYDTAYALAENIFVANILLDLIVGRFRFYPQQKMASIRKFDDMVA